VKITRARSGVPGPPDLDYAADHSVAWGMRLWGQAKLPNLLVKVPGTAPGLTAVEELVVAGVGVNVTLQFSETHYLQAAEAYMRALERRLEEHSSLSIPSVASVFVSRWDAAANPLLPVEMHNRLGIAVAQKAYSAYLALLASDPLAGACRGRCPAHSACCGPPPRPRNWNYQIPIT